MTPFRVRAKKHWKQADQGTTLPPTRKVEARSTATKRKSHG
jgi:hypothetical protein